MSSDFERVARECAELSAGGKIHFGEVLARLSAAGVERFHADYSRMETTYYSAAGGVVHRADGARGRADRGNVLGGAG